MLYHTRGKLDKNVYFSFGCTGPLTKYHFQISKILPELAEFLDWLETKNHFHNLFFFFSELHNVSLLFYFQPPGCLLDLDSSYSNSVAPSNSTTTANADLWGDFNSVSPKWGETRSVFSLLSLCKFMQHFLQLCFPHYGVPYLSLARYLYKFVFVLVPLLMGLVHLSLKYTQTSQDRFNYKDLEVW